MMEKSLAQAILDLPSEFESEDLLDAYELKLFEFKQFFLTSEVNPKLWELKRGKLKKLETAYITLTGDQVIFLSEKRKKYDHNVSFLKYYEESQVKLKLTLSQSTIANEISILSKAIEGVENEYFNWFLDITGQMKFPENDNLNVKSRISRNALLKLIEHESLNKEEEIAIKMETRRIQRLLEIK